MRKPVSYELLLDHLKDGVCYVDLDGVVTYWNQGAETITGFRRDEVIGLAVTEHPLSHLDAGGEALVGEVNVFSRVMQSDSAIEEEVFVQHANGRLVPVLTRVSPIRDSRGHVIGALEVFSDNSAKLQDRNRIEELEEIALLCPLTAVGNRRYAEIALKSACEELNRYGWRFAVLFADLDHFKSVNDTYGHKAGDEVLKVAAQALKGALRNFDFVGRWGGEEFIVILPNMNDELLPVVAERCRAAIESAVYEHDGKVIRITASLGATLAREKETTEELVERADQLMYQSKQAGRNRCSFDT
ncbi:MAG: diguanylate cyclase [Candidatus Hydrogenedens sp.]|nr:diguanylate cyclase [Candidatus Hydrogenedens sp.]